MTTHSHGKRDAQRAARRAAAAAAEDPQDPGTSDTEGSAPPFDPAQVVEEVEARRSSAKRTKRGPKGDKGKKKTVMDWSKLGGPGGMFSRDDAAMAAQLAALPFALQLLACERVAKIPVMPNPPPEMALRIATEAVRQWLASLTLELPEAHPLTVYLVAVAGGIAFAGYRPKTPSEGGKPAPGTPACPRCGGAHAETACPEPVDIGGHSTAAPNGAQNGARETVGPQTTVDAPPGDPSAPGSRATPS